SGFAGCSVRLFRSGALGASLRAFEAICGFRMGRVVTGGAWTSPSGFKTCVVEPEALALGDESTVLGTEVAGDRTVDGG
ncbi:MAG: hypothetical protein EBW11_07600, partial [Betaproteobacteria bacterium]|nr:hypothetical protein [Betaproteobacteria bacterium]